MGPPPIPLGVQGHQLPPPLKSRPCRGRSPGPGVGGSLLSPLECWRAAQRPGRVLSPGSAGTPSSSGRPCTTGPGGPCHTPSGTSWPHPGASWGDTEETRADARPARSLPDAGPGPSTRTHLGLAPSLEGRVGTQVLIVVGCGSRRMGARQP